MKLIKYCNSDHNPLLESRTIQLGTIAYYRGLDPKWSIADEKEGLATLVNRERRFIAQDNAGSNCYVFCVSTSELSIEQAKSQLNSDYDSRYYIAESSFFAQILAFALRDQLTIDDFHHSDKLGLTNEDISKLHITCHKKLVTYEDGSRDLPTHLIDDPINGPWSYNTWLQTNFTKRRKYVDDQEYRFLFMLIHPESRQILSVKKDRKILSFPESKWPLLSLTPTDDNEAVIKNIRIG